MSEDISILGTPNFDKFQIVKTGTTTVAFAADGSTSTVDVTHNLGYTPTVLAYYEGAGFYQFPLPYLGVLPTGANAGKIYQIVSWYVNDTTLTFYNQSQLQGTGGGSIRYYLLREISN